MATDAIGGFDGGMVKSGLFPIAGIVAQGTLTVKMIGGFIGGMAPGAVARIRRGMVEV